MRALAPIARRDSLAQEAHSLLKSRSPDMAMTFNIGGESRYADCQQYRAEAIVNTVAERSNRFARIYTADMS